MHLSFSLNNLDSEAVYGLNGSMSNLVAMIGATVRSRNGGVEPYGTLLAGFTWTAYGGDLSEFEDVYALTAGAGAGLIINQQIDLGVRLAYDIENAYPLLQFGGGFRF